MTGAHRVVAMDLRGHGLSGAVRVALRTTDEGVFLRPDAALARRTRYDLHFQDGVAAVADIDGRRTARADRPSRPGFRGTEPTPSPMRRSAGRRRET
ncbi:hypothetical protein [Actinomadura rifamycini]|uniref:hypothetical protein n=1 Tax=Actinomadura rifamycini TaxID=31962 RepID=UPI0012F93588|nr:hypothetical protein [Actinomadura rifamycini]